MAISSIITVSLEKLNNPTCLLHAKSVPVEFGSEGVRNIVADLRDTLYSSKIAVGLSAVQIGCLKRIFIINLDKDKGAAAEKIFINPVVISTRGSLSKGEESCLSVPNYRGNVKRREQIVIEYFDEKGSRKRKAAKGFEARVIQHELDHLDGILYPAKMLKSTDIEEFHFYTAENYPLQAKTAS